MLQYDYWKENQRGFDQKAPSELDRSEYGKLYANIQKLADTEDRIRLTLAQKRIQKYRDRVAILTLPHFKWVYAADMESAHYIHEDLSRLLKLKDDKKINALLYKKCIQLVFTGEICSVQWVEDGLLRAWGHAWYIAVDSQGNVAKEKEVEYDIPC